MKRWLWVGWAVLGLQLHATGASACGDTPYLLAELLPLPDAVDVPVDAALIASSNLTESVFVLRKVAPTGADGGAIALDAGASDAAASDAAASDAVGQDVPLDILCYFTFGGAVCVARPSEPLEPNTTYEWFATMVSPPLIQPGYLEPGAVQHFTTSSDRYQGTTPAPNVDVLQHDTWQSPLCGTDKSATLGFSATAVDAPFVVNITGVTPAYVMQAMRISAEEPNIEFALYSPPDCLTPEVFDVTGARTALAELCLSEVLPATAHDAEGEVVATPPAPSEEATSSTVEPTAAMTDEATSATADEAATSDATAEDNAESNGGVGLSPLDDADNDSGCAVASGAVASSTGPRSSGPHGAWPRPLWLLAGAVALSLTRRRNGLVGG